MTEGLDRLLTRVEAVSKQHADRPIVVLIAGGSASGKTYAVSRAIKESFTPDADIVSADDYYKGLKFMRSYLKEGEPFNFDDPRAVDLPGVAADIQQFKSNRAILKRHYSFVTGEPFTVDPAEYIYPKKIMVMEGLFTLDSQVAPYGDVRAFVDIGLHGRIIRRLLRDVSRTKQNPADILDYFTQMVHPMHEKYVQTTLVHADPGMVLQNEYDPQVEAHRSGMFENQIKFASTLSAEDFRQLRAERLAEVEQVDKLYNPGDRDLLETGEMVRVRREVGVGEKYILTYKGPEIGDALYRKRPKFEFEVEKNVADRFIQMYGTEAMTIEKHRTFYRLGSTLFSADRVKRDNQHLGSFIEFRLNDDQILDPLLLEKMGISADSGIRTPYARL